MKRNKIGTVLLIVVFLTGLCLLAYPKVSNYWNSLHSTKEVKQYVEHIESLNDEEYASILKRAEEYNLALADRENSFKLSDSQKQEYWESLNLSGSGIMGYIEIPVIGVTLPIYHGTSNAVLQNAVGHLEWTSLPVGGESSHCVLSGHRGLPSSKLFTDLDKVAEGDVFIIRILNEVYTYEVDRILIVEPEDTTALTIESGKDYCTLITCTPYAVNTHRMLVRGHRIENAAVASSALVTADAVQIEPLVVAPVLFAGLLILLTAICMLLPGKRRNE